MADAPYIKWWTSDFLTGVIDLSAEETGCYAILLSMMADRGGPLRFETPADRQHLARRCNQTTRAFNRCTTRLLDLGKLQDRNGWLGNKRMMAEILDRDKRSAAARKAAHAKWDKWRDEHPPTLPFEHEDQSYDEVTPILQPEKLAQKPAQKTAVKNEETPENSRSGQKGAQSPSRAGAIRAHVPEPESESYERSNDSKGSGVEDETAIDRLWEQVSAAAGFAPSSAHRIAEATDLVRQWRDAGIDFGKTVLPAIREVVTGSADPTSSLKRFDARIRHAHARLTGADKPGARTPIPEPLLHVDDEPPACDALRRDLLEHMGPRTYAVMCNGLRFTEGDLAGSDKVLQVRDTGAGQATRFLDSFTRPAMRSLAKRHGWADAW